MDHSVTPHEAPLEAVRGAIAACWLGDSGVSGGSTSADDAARLGRITLHAHQVDAVRQLRPLLDQMRGALLADAVGLGKTFTALALARDVSRVVVVCPAGLRDMWGGAASDAGISITTISMESLSRRPDSVAAGWAGGAPDTLIIVDEAHHFRNPHTRRYRALGRLAVGAQMLLLTATPVHNRIEELLALLSLFLGARARTLTEAARTRCIVRRSSGQLLAVATVDRTPVIDGPHVLSVGDDAAMLHAIAALPAPVPPRDGEGCGPLATLGLVRQWASSAGALRAALRRRLERAAALESAIEGGAYPSYRELRSWCVGDGAVQLALPDVLVPAPVGDQRSPVWASPPLTTAGPELLAAIRTHAAAVRALVQRLDAGPDVDGQRAEHLRAVARAHPGWRIVAFTAYEDTARTLYRRLRGDGRVCMLSARGGVVATGRIGRSEILAQFGPRNAVPSPAHRIDVLLTTDLLSEGVSLTGAGVVVHLDLPWTPARLEQRVGRLARLGSHHDRIYVYALAPPAASEVVLDVERRLRAKLDAAARAVGIAGSIVPPISAAWQALSRPVPSASANGPTSGPVEDDPVSLPEQVTRVRAIVRRWGQTPCTRAPADRASHPPPPAGPVCCTIRAPVSGFVAAARNGADVVLVAAAGGPPSDAPTTIAEAVGLADGASGALQDTAGRGSGAAVQAIGAWWSDRRASRDAGLSTIAGARTRLRVLARLAAVMRRAPVHLRPGMLILGDQVRRATMIPFGVGGEWVLGQLADASLPALAWLRAVAAFGDAYGGAAAVPAAPFREADLEIEALIVFQPLPPAAAAGTQETALT